MVAWDKSQGDKCCLLPFPCVCVGGGGREELGVGCVLTSHLFCFKTGSHIAVGDTQG